jgi:hypothetical protein
MMFVKKKIQKYDGGPKLLNRMKIVSPFQNISKNKSIFFNVFG